MTGVDDAVKEVIKKTIEEALGRIPQGHISELVVKETIRCVLYGLLKQHGLLPIPSFRNPRYPEGPVDLIGMKDAHTIEVAFRSNATIELADIKSLERVPSERKFVITFSPNVKKVEMSTFFLKPGIEHIHVRSPLTPFG
ncbi:MAG: hypothetical protein JW836_17335 [Deltaproteobacteria bacterium]|nr:hypothetical protein [Deltaproteobacteria bacterium]